jgi:hypothetical protein
MRKQKARQINLARIKDRQHVAAGIKVTQAREARPNRLLNPDYALEKDEAKQLKNSCFGHLFSNV